MTPSAIQRAGWLRMWMWLLLVLAGGCATIPDYDPPTISVTSVRLLPGSSLAPRFAIGLHIVNPNPIALRPDGIAYSVYIEDRRILNGASNDLPTIEAYGEEEVTLTAVADMFSSISLLGELMDRPRDVYEYRLEATVGLGVMNTDLRLVEQGKLDLSR